MNIEKLKQVEADFFYRFPSGFDNPEMIAIRKKHKLDQMIETTQEAFARRNFKLPDLIVQSLVKIISRSSLISVFEKPRFRDFAQSLSPESRQRLAQALGEFLHGKEQHGFESMLAMLQAGKLGKWSLMTIIPAYYRPEVEVYVKPTTVKGIIQSFELTHLQYRPTPTWEFYREYRSAINEMKTWVHPSLSRYNIAFSGFLLRSMQGNLYQ